MTSRKVAADKVAEASEPAVKPSPAAPKPVLTHSGWYECPACLNRSTVAASVVHGPHPVVKQ